VTEEGNEVVIDDKSKFSLLCMNLLLYIIPAERDACDEE
jgi:hypothetical protein